MAPPAKSDKTIDLCENNDAVIIENYEDVIIVNSQLVNLIEVNNETCTNNDVEALSHSVVDLTSALAPVDNNINSSIDDEVKCIGSSRPAPSYPTLDSSSEVTFIGTKRRRDQPIPPTNNNSVGDSTSRRGFVRSYPTMNSSSFLTNMTNSNSPVRSEIMNHVASSVSNSHSINNYERSRNTNYDISPSSTIRPNSGNIASSKKQSSKPTVPPMQKGKSMIVPTGFDALDMYYPHLYASQRTDILYQLLPPNEKRNGDKLFAKKHVNDWRVQFEKKNRSTNTLWFIVSSFSDYVASNLFDINNQKKSATTSETDQNTACNEDRKFPPSIGPISSELINTLNTYFRAHVNHHQHKTKLNEILPTDEESSSSGKSSITCLICSDNFDPIHTIPCSNENEIHFFCKNCFVNYATKTIESGPIQSIKCPLPQCNCLFSVVDAKATLSQWDVLMIEHRENSRDRRVALAAKAVLHCECGVVAIITEEDMGNGRVSCPGKDCVKRYCCKCGNEDHGKQPCPPPAETMQWLDKNSKECPNCKNRIEKNGGCDHMTCRPSAGGCGHEFWWTCLCPYKGHKSDCKRLGERRT